jgi:magnesium chelatase subunit D
VSEGAALDAVVTDAELALHLFVCNPSLFGGIVLRGDGPVRDAMVAFAKDAIDKFGPVAKIPSNVDTERLLGGLDLTATLATGQSVMRAGLLDSAAGGVVIVPMAERVQANVAAHIAQAMDGGDVAAILLDDSQEPDEAPPAVLTERMAFRCDVTEMRSFAGKAATKPFALSTVHPLNDEQLHAIATTSAALGIGSVRALIFANSAARAHAALSGRTQAIDDDIAAAVRLVLAPRATQMPQMEPPPPEPEDDQPQNDEPDDNDEDRNVEDIDLEDILLDAAAAAIPKHILDQIDGATKRGGNARSAAW